MRVTDTHRALHASLTWADRVWVAKAISPRFHFPASQVSPLSIASLRPGLLDELKRRIENRPLGLGLGEEREDAA